MNVEYSALSRSLASLPPRLRVEHRGRVGRMQELVDGEGDCAALPFWTQQRSCSCKLPAADTSCISLGQSTFSYRWRRNPQALSCVGQLFSVDGFCGRIVISDIPLLESPVLQWLISLLHTHAC